MAKKPFGVWDDVDLASEEDYSLDNSLNDIHERSSDNLSRLETDDNDDDNDDDDFDVNDPNSQKRNVKRRSVSIFDRNSTTDLYSEAYDLDGTMTHKEGFNRTKLATFFVAVFTLVGAVSGFGLYLYGSFPLNFFIRKNDKSSRYNYIRVKLRGIIQHQALKDPNSIQSRTLEWLADEDPRQLDPDEFEILERYILALLFISTGGKQWSHKANWMSAAHICEWENVECLTLGGIQSVNSLHMFQNSLRGKIPTELIKLSNLGEQFLQVLYLINIHYITCLI